MMSSPRVLFPLLYVCRMISQCSSLNILMTPCQYGSDVLVYARVAEKLLQRDHTVTFLLASTMPISPAVKRIINKYPDNIEVVSFHMETVPFMMTNDHAIRLIEAAIDDNAQEQMQLGMEDMTSMSRDCEDVMRDDVLFDKLKKRNLDIAIIDGLPCQCVLPYKLGIPYVFYTFFVPGFVFRQPDLPSFVPRQLSNDFSDKMSFLERLQNVFFFYLDLTFFKMFLKDDELVKKYVREKPFRSILDLSKQTSLCFYRKHPVLDYPQPTMPNIQIVTESTTPKPISDPDLLQFLDSAKHGVIVVSFGTLVNHFPIKITMKLLSAFGNLKQHVLWRFPNDDPPDIPINVKLLKWLPQNDLLGHPNTKLLIMHGGLASFMEAVYNGIPIISFPLFFDQKFIAGMIVNKHYGVKISIADFTGAQLVDEVNKVINDPTYKGNITKASAILHDELVPAGDVIDYWLKHVVKFGADHLRSGAMDMPLYAYFMLDILAFILLVIFIFVIVLLGILCVIKNMCSTSSKAKYD